MREMVRNLIFGSGVSFLISFSSLVLIARYFPLDFISDVKAVSIYGGWFMVVFSGQVHSAFLYYHNEKAASAKATRTFTLCFLSIAAFTCTATFYLVFPHLYTTTTVNRAGLLAFSLVLGFNLLFMVTPALYTAQGISSKLPSIMFFYPLSNLASLLLTLVFAWDLNGYAYALMCLCFAVLALSEWRKYFLYAIRNIGSFFSTFCRPFVGYATKISVSVFFESLGGRLDKMLASKYLSQPLFAKYSVLCFENPIAGLILNSYGLALVKNYQGGISGKEDDFMAAWDRAARLITFVNFPVSIFLIFHYRWFIGTVFGERFLDASFVFCVYQLVSLVRHAPFQALLRLQGLVHYNVVISVFSFVSTLCVGVLVLWTEIPWKWLAASYLGGWVAFNGIAAFLFSRVTQLQYRRVVLPRVWVARIAQCIFASCIAGLMSRNHFWYGLASFVMLYLTTVSCSDRPIRHLLLDNMKLIWSRS